MKVFVFGAGGILGQHLMLCVPPGIEAHFFRKTQGPLFRSIDLDCEGVESPKLDALRDLLNSEHPDVILNLAGESNVDICDQTGGRYRWLNSILPRRLAAWCDVSNAHYVHMGTQAVFDGTEPPYQSGAPYNPINHYGYHKADAETWIRDEYRAWTIVRGTFCLGIRPIPSVGRENPAEAMLAGKQPRQVDDRWFSVMFAEDAAESLWRIVQERPKGKIIHLGNPERKSRYDVAKDLGCDVQPAKHEDFPGLARRAVDTSYAEPVHNIPYFVGIRNLRRYFSDRETIDFQQRARELALFFKISFDEALAQLSRGFGPLHNEVTANFNRYMDQRPPTDELLLAWYRETAGYCWELSAYHCDDGFNYAGMCEGIAKALGNHTAYNVLCLGDGIGDLTMELRRRKMNAVYHDLEGSRTAAFAQHRFWMYGLEGRSWLTSGFIPEIPKPTFSGEFRKTDGSITDTYTVNEGYDAIVSLDYLEHVPNVESWVRSIYSALRPGGVFCAQNAFAIGSGPEGSMPMHLACNDRLEKDWDPLLTEIGFKQLASNWYQK